MLDFLGILDFILDFLGFIFVDGIIFEFLIFDWWLIIGDCGVWFFLVIDLNDVFCFFFLVGWGMYFGSCLGFMFKV